MREKLVNILAGFFDVVRETFEHASPSLFALMATLLPYLTPLPIAVLTAGSAETFLGFDGWIAGIFVFVLEGLGLLVTTFLVDNVVDLIRSRNPKTILTTVVLGIALAVYVVILVNLNVRLKAATGNISSEYANVVTLMCFLPMLSGVINGFYKLKLEHKTETQRISDMERQREDERWRIREENKVKVKLAKAGINPLQPTPVLLNADTSAVREQKEKHASDYRAKAIQFILDYQKQNGSYPAPRHVTERFGLEHSKNKGYMSTLIREVENGARE